MSIEIRPLQTGEEYRAVEDLQRNVWGAEDVEIIPHDVLITAQKNGGGVLGAFDVTDGAEELIGFTFAFIGLTLANEVKLCSHMAGVARGHQDRNVGTLLKLAQRRQALERGLNLITWTFDPLESRNARFNFHKLGVTCNTFLANVYGEMRDELNAGLPSDRFQVDWRIASDRVEECIKGAQENFVPSALRAEGVPLLNPPAGVEGGLIQPARRIGTIDGSRLLVEIPANFQQIKARDFATASAWRGHVRDLFEEVYRHGYTAVDLLVEDGRSFYLLTKLA
jgi:predicted GNAT superfamily acetyltransferase